MNRTIFLRPLQWIYCLYAVLLFLILMIPVFLWALLVAPLGNIRGGNLIYRACVLWGDLWFPLIFIWHRNLYEQPLRKGQSYIFVANHESYFDAAILVKAFRRPVRPLGKVEMARLPVFGFIYKRVIVTVDRASSGNRARSVQILKTVLRRGISVLVFPEGTFNTTEEPLAPFYDGAFRIAIETGVPVKPVLFLDAYARMPHEYLFSLNPGRSRALFLEEVPTEGMTLADVPRLKEQVWQLMADRKRAPGAGKPQEASVTGNG
ncbi:MAG TPA: lysophospholipid acyltransferase family protein [Chitinophagaceae bacterium]|nr:lysophospholipid acyltransferase family protein [Chitinophagaceae bacterium]